MALLLRRLERAAEVVVPAERGVPDQLLRIPAVEVRARGQRERLKVGRQHLAALHELGLLEEQVAFEEQAIAPQEEQVRVLGENGVHEAVPLEPHRLGVKLVWALEEGDAVAAIVVVEGAHAGDQVVPEVFAREA